MKYLFQNFPFIIFLFVLFLPKDVFAQYSITEIDSLLIIENEHLRNQISIKELIAWNKEIAKQNIEKKY